MDTLEEQRRWPAELARLVMGALGGVVMDMLPLGLTRRLLSTELAPRAALAIVLRAARGEVTAASLLPLVIEVLPVDDLAYILAVCMQSDAARREAVLAGVQSLPILSYDREAWERAAEQCRGQLLALCAGCPLDRDAAGIVADYCLPTWLQLT